MSFTPAPRLLLVLAVFLLAGAAWIAWVAWRKLRDALAVRSPIFGKLWIVPTHPQPLLLSLAQGDDGVRFQVRAALGKPPSPVDLTLITLRPDGVGQRFDLRDRQTYLESTTVVPEPHVFTVRLWCAPDPRGHDIEIQSLDVHQAFDAATPQGQPAERLLGRQERPAPHLGLDAIKSSIALAFSALVGLFSLTMAAVSFQALLAE